ncbi:MAG: TlpA family protein disulfide reductase [Saprospiraceae bacterium]|nr:TlpA family protein disulfide reductase [Saprospiraceae bacterium]
MKNLYTLILFLALVFTQWSCAPSGQRVEGTLTNAQNLQVFLDQVIMGKANSVIGKTDLDANGNFAMDFETPLAPGIYNFRIGAKRVNLFFDGTEQRVTINGDLNTIQQYNFTISGSSASQSLAQIMNGLVNRQYQADDIENFIDSVSNPLLGAFVAYKALGGNPDFLDLQKKAQARLVADMPNDPNTVEYGKYLAQVERQYQAKMANQKVQVGQPAPDIALKSPSGKEYSLADLKGNIVLLDFWASWCGPCRRENPNVVKVYEKYKKQGFTVFSVSLDGVDTRSRNRVQSEDQVNKLLERSKDRWVNAIAQDGLAWEYHVSDLKKWESLPASTYGVRSIPRTFMIDREGKIAALNLRGAQQIERELVKILEKDGSLKG